MIKYIIKRIALMLLTLFIIVSVCFCLVRMLPRELPTDKNLSQVIEDRWEALGYNEPLPIQYAIYLKGIFTKWDFGTSWYISFRTGAWELVSSRILPTILVNLYSLLLSTPLGFLFGIYSAIKKNKWQDRVISIGIMILISVPSYIYAFLVQYILGFKLGLFPMTVYSLSEAGGWLTPLMLYSMIPAVLSLSFSEIAGLSRMTRAELSESMSADYMLLARAKGQSRMRAVFTHALRNALIPILPILISNFVGILSGSMIIEQIFSVPGVGQLYVRSISMRDYDVFMLETILYTFVALLAGLCVDIGYCIIDPRIKLD